MRYEFEGLIFGGAYFRNFTVPPFGSPGVLQISRDRDDRRILLGLKFSIPGFFWVA